MTLLVGSSDLYVLNVMLNYHSMPRLTSDSCFVCVTR